MVDARSCEQEYVPASSGDSGHRGLTAANYARENGTFYNGNGWIFRGKIHLIATTAGYKEAKGRVDFVTDFQDGVAVNITRGYGYGDDEYYSREEERYYGRDEQPYYGHEQERHHGREEERQYGREDDPKYSREEERDYDQRAGQHGKRQYSERRYDEHPDSGPYEARVQGFGFGSEYPGGSGRPWLKAGNLQITLYEAEYN